MSALLAPDGIALLQRNLGIAVAAQIVDGGAFASSLEGVSARRRRHNRNLVSFSRHFALLSKISVCVDQTWLGCGEANRSCRKLKLKLKQSLEAEKSQNGRI